MKTKHPTIPFYFIMNGDKKDLKPFFVETKSENIPYTLFNGAEEFMQMNGSAILPGIKWVEDTTVIEESNYLTLDEKEIIKWIK
jgi:hypothetical protein